MEFKTRIKNDQFVELAFDNGGTGICVDLSTFKEGKSKVPQRTIENFISIAYDCSGFNGVPDIDFVHNIVISLLNDTEKQELIKRLTNSNHGE